MQMEIGSTGQVSLLISLILSFNFYFYFKIINIPQHIVACVPKDCGALTGLSHASATCSPTTYNSACVAKCATGYKEDAGSDNSYRCNENGQWAEGAISCKIVDCGALTPTTGAQGVACASTVYQSSCTATCLPGYDYVSGTITNYVCNATGFWVGGNIGEQLISNNYLHFVCIMKY
jgi:hypothetical protein